ncbi:MAG TPA: hypothetical protein P5531_10480 [Bacteroidales bacterium]|nr:hypothetical protein [Bacteroidales bacterium]HSA43612.1 hypothetical protein [Bacteroidales bacterium]
MKTPVSKCHPSGIISACFAILCGLLFMQQLEAQEYITTISDWTNVYHGTSTEYLNIPYDVPEGSNDYRLLVMAVSVTRASLSGFSCTTPQYGLKSFTHINSDLSVPNFQSTALFYLKESELDQAVNNVLRIRITSSALYNRQNEMCKFLKRNAIFYTHSYFFQLGVRTYLPDITFVSQHHLSS